MVSSTIAARTKPGLIRARACSVPRASGPLVVILLLVSIVGLWLGLITLVLYFLLLLLGYLTGVLFVADAGLQRLRRPESPGKGWVIGALAVTLVVLAPLRLPPVPAGP